MASNGNVEIEMVNMFADQQLPLMSNNYKIVKVYPGTVPINEMVKIYPGNIQNNEIA